ncbi:single-pass membrane and coiled-coil domain-containing protein 3-like [Triplophysa rosa]|uniref:single-pass membrane and coiled-coil domain-containing protein 3-like n=1 Tax=Triplophysa rosa TaxID=992332 RepID=UPI002545F4E9|nr:single-pass membrane and coiled-coil domain-containing protein 3-like [Triplophysa rosa]XP_057188176.1 single-pass membrane and coiled-coil domain-containing protein 3-like [Triplophysa rosa]
MNLTGMNLSDIFYPGNPDRRERLVRKSQEVLELMKHNFRATNQLIEVLQEHLGLHFSPVKVNEKATVKENCDVLIERIREIQVEVGKIDMELKEMLEPTLYEKLRRKDLSIPERSKISTVLRGIHCCVATIASAYIVGWLFQNVAMLASITGVCGVIAMGFLGCVVFGVLFMGVDMIIQAILGSTERDRLERALKEYDDVLKDFRPASEKYQESITEVKLTIQLMQK